MSGQASTLRASILRALFSMFRCFYSSVGTTLSSGQGWIWPAGRPSTGPETPTVTPPRGAAGGLPGLAGPQGPRETCVC